MRKKKHRRHRGLIALLLLVLVLSTASWGGEMARPEPESPAPEPGAAAASPAVSSLSPGTGDAASGESGHTHSWEPVYGTVHREAVTEDVWVLDREAWLEPKEAARNKCSCRCGVTGTYDQVSAHIQGYKDAWLDDPTAENEAAMQKHNFDTSDLSNWIVHEAEGHWEEQVVQDAYDGSGVVGFQCSVCGQQRDR